MRKEPKITKHSNVRHTRVCPLSPHAMCTFSNPLGPSRASNRSVRGLGSTWRARHAVLITLCSSRMRESHIYNLRPTELKNTISPSRYFQRKNLATDTSASRAKREERRNSNSLANARTIAVPPPACNCTLPYFVPRRPSSSRVLARPSQHRPEAEPTPTR